MYVAVTHLPKAQTLLAHLWAWGSSEHPANLWVGLHKWERS